MKCLTVLVGIVLVLVFVCAGALYPVMANAGSRGKGLQRVEIRDRLGKRVGGYDGSYALVIGVSDYTAGWPVLESVPGELRQVAEALEIQGFSVEKLENLKSKELKEAYERFIGRYGYDKNNRLLFFFSGHGYSRGEGKKGYLVPADAPDPRKDEKGFLRSAITMGEILTWSRKIEAKHAIFLFDSCFSGTIFKAKALPKEPPHITSYTASPVRQFISAGSAGEEVPAQSVFTPSFVRALRGEADLNRDRYVTGTELGMYLHDKVLGYDTGQTPQYGKINDPDLDEGDFVFHLGGREVVKDVEPPHVPERPPGMTFDPDKYRDMAGKYEEEARKAEAVKKEWSNLLSGIKSNYSKLLELDNRNVPPRIKISAWKEFQGDTGVQQDNPYSTEDEDIRKKIAERIAHWEVEEERVSEDLMKQAARKPAEEQVEKSAQQKAVAQSGRVAGEVWKEPVTGMEFVWVEGGSFKMGDLFGDGGGDEKYIRKVRLDGFWLGKYEVTQGEWQKIMGNNPAYFKKGDNYPVENVSWDDVQEFISKLNSRKNGNYTFRLPSEAEWEYAAREGGSWARFGDGWDIAYPSRINFYGGKDYKEFYSEVGEYRGKTTPVGSFSWKMLGLEVSGNMLGLYDMSGNVWEWCEDIYTDDYSKVGTDNPIYRGSGSLRVNRGGSWNSGPRRVRASYRNRNTPAYRRDNLGFRLARTP